MPSLLDHSSSNSAKLLIAADSGAGKTGALASLIDAGLRVRILDFDNGISVLKGFVKDKAKLSTHVHYVELHDSLKLTAGRVGISKANAFQRAMDALDKGSADLWGENFGPIETWGDDTVLVLDTLSSAGRASLNMVMQLNGKGFAAPEIQHSGVAMENIERMLDILTSEAVKCHVIVNTHLTNVEGTAKLYPEALGSKLSPKIGRKFDNMLTLSITAGARTFKTQKDGLFACKTAIPMDETLPIATGLATIFKKLTGKVNL